MTPTPTLTSLKVSFVTFKQNWRAGTPLFSSGRLSQALLVCEQVFPKWAGLMPPESLLLRPQGRCWTNAHHGNIFTVSIWLLVAHRLFIQSMWRQHISLTNKPTVPVNNRQRLYKPAVLAGGHVATVSKVTLITHNLDSISNPSSTHICRGVCIENKFKSRNFSLNIKFLKNHQGKNHSL